MTLIFASPADYAEEALDGFVAASRAYVALVQQRAYEIAGVR